MSGQRPAGRRGIIWAVIGGIVLLGAVIALVAALLIPRAPDPVPDPTSSQIGTAAPTGPAPSVSATPSGVVDESVVERGWVAEPITTDADVYMRAALAAASTFDTTLSTRDEWLAYLDTWFTPDTRYATEQDRQIELDAARLELRQGVVKPEVEWDALAAEDGRVVATVAGEVVLSPVPDDESGAMSIRTADVVLEVTVSDGAGGTASFEESVRVSVQVLCGEGSMPTPNSGQRAGDCKVVRYFTEPLEP